MGQKINIVMDQGSTFYTTFNIVDANNNPIDLSIYTASSQMRRSYDSTYDHAFVANSYSNGVISLSMAAANTECISSGRYVYDIELTDMNGNRSRVIEGMVTVTPQVTR